MTTSSTLGDQLGTQLSAEVRPECQQNGVVKAVLPMHIYNLCLGRNPLPALILDIRSAEDFNLSHIVNTWSCPIESLTPTLAHIHSSLPPAPLQRFKSREHAIVAIVSLCASAFHFDVFFVLFFLPPVYVTP
jgi:hypothetical protein